MKFGHVLSWVSCLVLGSISGGLKGQEGEASEELLGRSFAEMRELPFFDETDGGEDMNVFSGLFDYLGSGWRTHAGLTDRVAVTGPALEPGSSQVHEVLGGGAGVTFASISTPGAILEIQLIDAAFAPVSYTLTHPLEVDTSFLRDWVLEGSLEGEEWIRLSEHSGDTTLDKAGQQGFWSIENETAYPWLRLRMTGPNSNDKETLVLAGIELHGVLHADNLDPEPLIAKPSRRFVYGNPSDGESAQAQGFLSFLAKGQNAELQLNPALQGWVTVETSGTSEEAPPPHTILPPERTFLETTPATNAWVSVGLGQGEGFVLESYLLYRDPESGNPPLESWVMEGSNNGLNWEIVHNGAEAEPDSEDEDGFLYLVQASETSPPFRHHRLRMIGTPSENEEPIRLAGVEFFGRYFGVRLTDEEAFDPPCEPRVFTYEGDFDGQGIVAYLATSDGAHAYRNPALRGLLTTSSSPIVSDSLGSHVVVGESAARFITRPQPEAWVQIDFGTNRIRPNHYSLRHYSSFDTEALRNWKLQGSNDGVTWLDLREHENDTALNGKGDEASWPLNDLISGLGFSKFRILQTGVNSNNQPRIALSGFEIYGTWCPDAPPPPLLPAERTFTYSEDFDGDGLVAFLATRDGQTAYRNPAALGLMGVRASSLMRDSQPASSAVGDAVVRCVTQPRQHSWFEFDFKDIEVDPTRYTLRHYSSWDTEALRNWVMEGSNDGQQWFVLDSRTNDTSLSNKGDTATFVVESSSTTEHYRRLRIRQTGRNSNLHYYLALSGFEVYGHARSTTFKPAPEPDLSTDFDFGSTFDGKGIVTHLATNGGAEPYRNPVDRGLARVMASSLMIDSEPAKSVLGNQTVRCVTKPHRNSWFAIEFPGLDIRPTHYSLRHYSSWDTEALRTWDLEGSNDGQNWTVLRRHADDASLDQIGAEASWPLPGVGESDSYSHFRIIQRGRNSNAHDYLALSGFEIYGTLAAGGTFYPDGITQPAPTRGEATFSINQPFEGILHYLGTANGSQPFVNPATSGLVATSASSLMQDSQAVSAIAGKQTVRCVTKPKPSSWMMLDFGAYRVLPNYYSLRHYSSWDTEALRSWRLEGSNDNQVWETLSTHLNDASLSSRGDEHSWPVVGAGQPYRYLRIIQTGLNSNQHHYLALSGFEVFGQLYTGDFSDNPTYNQWAVANGLAPGVDQGLRSDPNQDGVINLGHFAFGDSPTATTPRRSVIRPSSVLVQGTGGGGSQSLGVTFPMRQGGVLLSDTIQIDGITYTLRTSFDLQTNAFLQLEEIIPAQSSGLPPLPSGYVYRTFGLTKPPGTGFDELFFWIDVN